MIDFLGDLKGLTDKPRLTAASEFAMRELRVTTQTNVNEQLDRAIKKAKLVDDMPALIEKLDDLSQSMPKQSEYKVWKDWNHKVLGLMNESFNIGHKVIFDEETQKLLDDYIYANNLMMKCILRENVSSFELREQIFDCILLPSNCIHQKPIMSHHTSNPPDRFS